MTFIVTWNPRLEQILKNWNVLQFESIIHIFISPRSVRDSKHNPNEIFSLKRKQRTFK